MNSEGLGEIFEGESADTCGEKFPLVLMGGRAEGLAYADPEARTPIGDSEFFCIIVCTSTSTLFIAKNGINYIKMSAVRCIVNGGV